MKYVSGVAAVLAGVILITAVAAAVVLGSAPAHTESSAQAVADTTEVAVNPYQAPLEQMVDGFAGRYSDTTGLYVIDLTHDAQASHNESQQFVAASLYKLFVAYVVLDAVDTGERALSDIMQETGTTVEYCLDVMITVSDNACGIALGKLVGWQTIDERLWDEGYGDTTLNNYDTAGNLVTDKLTTPRDIMTLLRCLYDGTLLSATSTEYFMTLLEQQTLNYALPTGLDGGVSFAHKTGVLDDVSHDAGFLTYGDREMLIVMMTDGWTAAYDQSPARFAEFGALLSTYIKTTHEGA